MTLATPPVSDPAAAVAVARCILARFRSIPGTLTTAVHSGHPAPCQWDDYPLDVLLEYARAFRSWAFDGDGNITDPGSVAFHALPRREQRRLRYLAQYGEEPPGRDGSVQVGMAGASAPAVETPGPTADRDSGSSGGLPGRRPAPDSPAVQPGVHRP